jgi:hypothetical protein
MTDIHVQLGSLDDVDEAVSVYERSNLVRRQGDWPSRPARVAQITAADQRSQSRQVPSSRG